ncbi:MAG: putative dsRNA-binding protein [Holophagaceae bacterium]|nr:putative dsRNA-binding protein [Holophagaceae bacterium]
MSQLLTALEKKIGYQFNNRELLKQALTPPSAGLPIDNQRLEFFGDSVLQLCSTRLVYNSHHSWQEGSLSKLRGKVVSTDSLHVWALDMEIALEHGPRSLKNKRGCSPKELADAVEALLAAVVLDAEANGDDGIACAFAIVEGRFGEIVRKASKKDWEKDDPKTALQEKTASLGLSAPKYDLIEKTGPDHAPSFKCRVCVGELEVEASGSTLKRAQVEAARVLLGLLAQKNDS